MTVPGFYKSITDLEAAIIKWKEWWSAVPKSYNFSSDKILNMVNSILLFLLLCSHTASGL